MQTHSHKVIIALIILSLSISILGTSLGTSQCLAEGNKSPK